MSEVFAAQTPPTVQIFQNLQDIYLGLGLAVAAVVLGWFLYNIIRHREKGNTPPQAYDEGRPETWKRALTFVLITASILATVETATFLSTGLAVVPQNPNALHINVIGRQWSWQFQYPNGNRTSDILTVPIGRDIILNITSIDVHHSFWIPGLYVKADALPGQLSSAWFNVPQPGDYDIYCAELCGLGHSTMIATLHVISASAYAQLHYEG